MFNILYNILIAFLLKYGGSNVLYLSMTAIVPIVDVAFSLDFIPGHEPFTVFSVLGLCVIVFGLFVYRFSGHLCDMT